MITTTINDINKLVAKVIASGKGISKDEALSLIQTPDLDALCNAADRITKAFHSNQFDSCSIVNARSGMCGEDCKWCAQTTRHHTGCSTYNILEEDKTLKAAHLNNQTGIRRFSLVTSGRSVSDSDLDKFLRIIRRLKEETDLHLCVSMGLLTESQLKRLKEAGIERYHCNMETSERMWPSLVTTHTQSDKRKTIEAARRQGMEICSGGIIGMGETQEDRIDFAIMLRDMEVDSVPMNILNPIKHTPLENTPLISEEEIIRCAAVWRFILPTQVIRFAGGRGRLSKANMKRLFQGGINGAIMGDMLTTIGNTLQEDFDLIAASGLKIYPITPP
ncbi:MAG: biotin synthase BioB [Muribaculaceae bacterium]|nr:biotin synthase BioB [Muribaculaceae bacterium]